MMDDYSQFALPEEERRRLLLSNLMMGLGAGLLDSRGKNVWPAISTGLLGGMQMGQQAIAGAQKMRGDSITQALNAAKLRRESEMQDYIARELRGGPTPVAGAFPTPGPVANQFGPATNRESAPTTKRTLLQKAELLGVSDAVKMAIASGGPEGLRKAAEIIANASKPNTVSAGQSVYDPTGKLLYSAPNVDKGMALDENGTVRPLPGYEETVAGITGATESAKASMELVDVPMPDGSIRKMTRSDAARILSTTGQPSQSGMPPRWEGTQGGPSPDEQRWITQQGGPNFRNVGGGVIGQGPAPLAVKAGEEAIRTDAEMRRSVNSAVIGQLDKMYPEVNQFATSGIPTIHEARKALESGIMSGAGANFGLSFGTWLSQMGVKSADSPVENTQVFAKTQARQVLSIIKSLGSGSGISDADREYAAGIVGGDITLNEGSLRRLLDISERAQRAQISAYNKRVLKAASLFKNPDLSDLYMVQEPSIYVGKPAAPVVPKTVIKYDKNGRRIP